MSIYMNMKPRDLTKYDLYEQNCVSRRTTAHTIYIWTLIPGGAGLFWLCGGLIKCISSITTLGRVERYNLPSSQHTSPQTASNITIHVQAIPITKTISFSRPPYMWKCLAGHGLFPSHDYGACRVMWSHVTQSTVLQSNRKLLRSIPNQSWWWLDIDIVPEFK